MKGMAGFAVILMVTIIVLATCVDGKEFTDHQEKKVLRHLKRLNKPAVKSIMSEDGDVIDCVPITRQPAFDHPLLKDHIIQMRPSFDPESDSKYTKKESKTITQVWHKNGECPKNTIPIRRTKKEDLLRPKSIESFGKKSHLSNPRTTSHQHAIAGVGNGMFYGTKFTMNIWRPYVQVPEEFSLAQTWVMSGNGSTLNTIEAGWQVYPQLYNDSNPSLFVYWTRDGYQKTGCYNLLCSGFVQTNNRYSLVGSFNTVSRYRGVQYELPILIWMDRKTGNWWLRVNDKDDIGYWPSSLFTSLGKEATIVEWGGEIVNSNTGGRHTTTDMGSGHFADEGFEKASYFRELMIVDGTNTLKEPQEFYLYAEKDNCYNVKTGNGGPSWGVHFFYGGPGRNIKCP